MLLCRYEADATKIFFLQKILLISDIGHYFSGWELSLADTISADDDRWLGLVTALSSWDIYINYTVNTVFTKGGARG